MQKTNLHSCNSYHKYGDNSIFSVLERVSKLHGNPLYSVVRKTYADGQIVLDNQYGSCDASSLEKALIAAESQKKSFPLKSSYLYQYDSFGNIYMLGAPAILVLYRNPGTGSKPQAHFHQ